MRDAIRPAGDCPVIAGVWRLVQDSRSDEKRKTFTVEIAIPLKVKGVYDYTNAKAYNFTIMRQAYNGNTFNPAERIGWHPMFFTAHRQESRGLVFMK